MYNKQIRQTKLYKETNEKFCQRIFWMLFNTCGCDKDRAIEILSKVLYRVRCMDYPKDLKRRMK